MPFEIVISILLKIFIMVLFGFALKKMRIITEELQKGLNQLLVKAILPISILMSSNNPYTSDSVHNMLLVALIAGIYYFLALVLSHIISRILKISPQKRNVFITMAVFANVAFIGFPILYEMYGTEGLLYGVVYNIFYQLFFFTYGLSLLSGEKKMYLSMLYKNPVTVASAISVVLFITQIHFPESIASAFTTIGSMTTPLSMILIGGSLAEVKFRDIILDKYSYLVSAMRMVVYPLCMLVALYFLQVPAVIAGSCALLTALPAGSLNVIYAQQYNCEPGFASRTVIQTMVFMVVTLPVILFLISIFF